MKQKRTFVTLLLIVAILGLGIAYAAITDFDLTITGNLTVATDANNFGVEFINTEDNPIVVTKSEGIPASATATAVIDSADSTSRTIKVDVAGLTTKDQTVTVVCPVQNTSTDDLAANLSDINAAITKKDSTDASTYFSLDGAPVIGKARLEKGEDTTITFTIKLDKTPISDADVTEAQSTVTITFNAAPDQPTAE